MADTSHSKVSGTLLDPTLSSDKNNTSTAPKKGKEFPKTGEKAYFPLRLIGIPIVLFSGTIWYARKLRMDMTKKYKYLFAGSCLGFLLIAGPIAFANSATSSVTGEVIPGRFSMTTPNGLNFQATLTGHEQTIHLKAVHTQITDYRGLNEGWTITVQSPNFDTYAQNYQLIINNQAISHSETIVYNNNKQSMSKKINLPVKVAILTSAKAGTYIADLEWNLQPNINRSLKE